MSRPRRFDGMPSRAGFERFFLLDDAGKALIADRRGDHNRLGFDRLVRVDGPARGGGGHYSGRAAGKRMAVLARYQGVRPELMDFAEFYAASRAGCLRAVLAVTGDQAAAEDFVAEAFARAWASWRTVGRHPVPQAWVVRTALNLRVSWWRRRRREVALGDQDAQPAASLPGLVDPQLMRLLAGLPERQRQVIALRIFVDLDVAQTAAALGIAPGTVRAHHARGIAALRACLTPGSPQVPQRPAERQR